MVESELDVADGTRLYWEAASRGELRLPRCLDCGHRMFPPSPTCTECLSQRIEWERMSGRGSVFSYVVYHRAWRPEFRDRIPYNVALVELSEGPQLISTIVGCERESLVVGMSVEVVFETGANGLTLPKFKPAEKT